MFLFIKPQESLSGLLDPTQGNKVGRLLEK